MWSVDNKLILEKHPPDGASRSSVIWTFLDDASISDEPFPFAGDILGVNLAGLTGTGIGVTPLFSAQKNGTSLTIRKIDFTQTAASRSLISLSAKGVTVSTKPRLARPTKSSPARIWSNGRMNRCSRVMATRSRWNVPQTSLRACLKSQKASVIRPISEAEFESWPDRPRQRRWSLSFHSRERDGDDASANQKSFRQPIDGEAP
jgi:hypothetical protein